MCNSRPWHRDDRSASGARQAPWPAPQRSPPIAGAGVDDALTHATRIADGAEELTDVFPRPFAVTGRQPGHSGVHPFDGAALLRESREHRCELGLGETG